MIGRRLWAALMLASDPYTAESVLSGLPVRAGNLDPIVLARALRGRKLPPAERFVQISHEHLDAIAEAGPLVEKKRMLR